MKLLFSLLILSVSLFAKNLNYIHDFNDAISLAETTSKKVLMIYKSPSCGECSRMENVVFKDKKLKDYLSKNYVLLELDITKDDLPPGFTFIGVPTYFVLDASGVEVAKLQGSSPDAKIFLDRFQNHGL
jgi:thioredoxin-related protein